MHDQFASGWRGECALADALDKLQAAAVFQFTDLLADCRLRQMQAFRRLGEAAERDDLNQSAQLVEAEVPHDKPSLSKPSQLSTCLTRVEPQ
jgi:hypothetical protein